MTTLTPLSVTVSPAVTSKMLIVLPGQSFAAATGTATGSVTPLPAAGSAFSASVYALDQYKNINTAYTGSKTLVWTMVSGTANGPTTGTDSYPSPLTFAAGQVSGSITLYRAQPVPPAVTPQVTLSVTETLQSYGQTSSAFTVSPGSTASLEYTTASQTVAVNTVSAQVTVRAKDAWGNVDTANNSPVTLTSTSATTKFDTSPTGLLTAPLLP